MTPATISFADATKMTITNCTGSVYGYYMLALSAPLLQILMKVAVEGFPLWVGVPEEPIYLQI